MQNTILKVSISQQNYVPTFSDMIFFALHKIVQKVRIKKKYPVDFNSNRLKYQRVLYINKIVILQNKVFSDTISKKQQKL